MKILDDIKARCSAATPAPWIYAYHNRTEAWTVTQKVEDWLDAVNYNENIVVASPDGRDQYMFNTEFIAHAREDIPRLVAALEEAIMTMKSTAQIELKDETWRESKTKTALKKIESILKGNEEK